MHRRIPTTPLRTAASVLLAVLALQGCRGTVFNPVTKVERVVSADGIEFDLAVRGPLGWVDPLDASDVIGLDLDYFVLHGETWRRVPGAGWLIEPGVTATAPVIVRREPLKDLLATGGNSLLAVVERSSGQVTAHLVVGSLAVETADVLRQAITGTASVTPAPEHEKITVVPERTPVAVAEFDARGREDTVPLRQIDRFGCEGVASIVDSDPIRLHTAHWDYAPLAYGDTVSCSQGRVIVLSSTFDAVTAAVLGKDGRLVARREIAVAAADRFLGTLHRPQRATIVDGALAFDAYETSFGDGGAEQHFRSRVTVPLEPAPPPLNE